MVKWYKTKNLYTLLFFFLLYLSWRLKSSSTLSSSQLSSQTLTSFASSSLSAQSENLFKRTLLYFLFIKAQLFVQFRN